MEKDIEKKKSDFKKKNSKGYVRFLTRLQQKYPQLTINQCSTEEGSQYSKQCQRRRQPMGTGEGFQPQIVDFNYNIEKDKLKDLENVSCKIEVTQKGGGVDRSSKDFFLKLNDHERENIYATWGIKMKPELYKNKMHINDCLKGKSIEKSYKIKDLKTIANDYFKIDIDIVQKNDICLILKQLENEREISIMYKKLYGNGSFESEEDKNVLKTVIAMRESRFQYVKSSDINKDFLQELGDELNIKKKNITDTDFQNTIMELLEKDDSKLLKFLYLEHIQDMVAKTSIRMRVIYEVYNLYTNWSKKHMKVFLQITDSETQDKLEEKLSLFQNKFLRYNQTTKKQRLTDMTLKEFIEETEMLVRKDEMGNIIQSVLKFNNKALTCPNYDDNKNNSMVGFLDIPVNQIPSGKSDSAIRKDYCQPCCFINKKDPKTGETILSNNYLKNVLFCTGKMSYDEYKNIIESEQRGENYISTNYNVNNVNNYGILQPEMNKFFNNFTNFYNNIKGKKVKNTLMTKFKNNLLKSDGFVLQGIKQQNSFLNNVLTSLDYTKDELIDEINEYLNKNPLIFDTLNEGGLFLRFKNHKNYIQYLEEEPEISSEYLIDIISRKNVISRFPNGVNVFIFTEEEKKINLEFHDFLKDEGYIDNKTHIYTYKHSNGFHELIILKLYSKDENIRYFDRESNYELMVSKEMKDVLDELQKFVEQWYEHAAIDSIVSIKTLIEKLGIKNITGQIVDRFKKTLFIVYKDILIPVRPMGYNPKLDILNKNEPVLKSINKYKKSLKNTLKYVEILTKKFGLKRYKFSKYVAKNNKITGIELKNGLLIDVKEEDVDPSIRINKFSDKTFYYEINDILFENEDKNLTTVNDLKKSYDEELFNLFKLEVSKYLSLNENVKKDVIKILDDKFNNIHNKEQLISMDSFHIKLTKIVEDIYSSIVTNIEEDDLINYDKNKSNIRKSCILSDKDSCSLNPSCVLEGFSCKIKIPLYKKSMFISLFTSELLMNSTFSEIIIKDKVNTVINKNQFSETDTSVFRKKNIII